MQSGFGGSLASLLPRKKRPSKLTDSERKEVLRRVVLDKESILQYGSPLKIYQYLRLKYPLEKFSLNEIKKFIFDNLRSKRIIRNVQNRKFTRLPYRTWGYGDLVQADLLFMPEWNRQNVLTVIDVFSRKADAEVLLNKSGSTVLLGLMRILKRMNLKPSKLQTDKGTEFYNSKLKAFCKKNDIIHFSTDTAPKASVVERLNRTIHAQFSTIKREEPKAKAREIIQRIIKQYNDMPHAHLKGRAPSSINRHNAGYWLEKELADRRKQLHDLTRGQRPFKFKEGDYVRATIEPSFFHKGFKGILQKKCSR